MAITTFAIPLSKFRSDVDLQQTYDFVSKLDYKTGRTGVDQTSDSFLHKREELKGLVNDILEAANYHSKDIGYKETKLKITQMWCNRYKKGSQIHVHTHSNSFLSGVFTISGDTKDATVFINPLSNLRDMWNIARDKETEYSADNFYNPTEPGQIVIFPSWLQHATSVVECDNRCTISFNLIPTELGDKTSLNYVEIG